SDRIIVFEGQLRHARHFVRHAPQYERGRCCVAQLDRPRQIGNRLGVLVGLEVRNPPGVVDLRNLTRGLGVVAGVLGRSGQISDRLVKPPGRQKRSAALVIPCALRRISTQELGEVTDGFLEPTEGIELGRGSYPAHHVRTLPGNIKVAEYSGRVVVQFDARAEKSLVGESARIAGVVRYQACNEAGQCFRPQNIKWEITVPIGEEGEPVGTVGGEYFADAGPSAEATAPALEAPRKALAKLLVVKRAVLAKRIDKLVLPTTYLIDKTGKLTVLYEGSISIEQLLADVRGMEESHVAPPFPGQWLKPPQRDLVALARFFADTGLMDDARTYIMESRTRDPRP
ncbi:MAG: hypothetical protein IID39_01505, partial [Planctomycetes bacterium]|nr:hypothetical protein [Planctomycetota bacterium]